MADSKFVELASMFCNTSDRTGKTYYVGYMGAAKVYLFEKRQPDERGRTHTLYVSAIEPKGDKPAASQAPAPRPEQPKQRSLFDQEGGDA